MEMLDILNPDGTDAGYTADKSEAHAKGLWHRVAHIWIIDSENNVVLQRRSKNKENHPDIYDISVAGHISAGESPVGGALREAEEETGIIFSEINFIPIGKYSSSYTLFDGLYINNEWVYLYVLYTDILVEDFIPQPSEVDHFINLPIAELSNWIVTGKEDCICDPKSFEMLNDYLLNK